MSNILDKKSQVREKFLIDSYEVVFTPGTSESAEAILVRSGLTYPTIFIQQDIHGSHLHERIVPSDGVSKPLIFPMKKDLECRLDWNGFEQMLDENQSAENPLIMLTHASNVSGVVHPLENMVNRIRKTFGDQAYIYVDMAQTMRYNELDLNSLPVDAIGFSPYKITFKEQDDGLGILLLRDSTGFIDSVNVDVSRIVGSLIDTRMVSDKCVPKKMLQELSKLDYADLIRLYGPRTYHGKTPVFAFSDTVYGQRQSQFREELQKKGLIVKSGYRCMPFLVPLLLGDEGERQMSNLREQSSNFPTKRANTLSSYCPDILRFGIGPSTTMEQVERYAKMIGDVARNLSHR